MGERLFLFPEDGPKPLPPWIKPRFDGATYEPEKDEVRLTGQLERVWSALSKGGWWTLRALSEEARGTEASVSARLRDLRKERFGAHTITRRRVDGGLYAYRLERKTQ